ncbi:hypothetical protein [[Phormidium] sp. ETS-05]|uniref:hypothetical protein n=1 Tax=[Phormidium] sp. ETS-05 TaxID=222819 RepID=UPI0018EED208|nr:hypothetical protein [[Phormidium] sp. ETS-05]
MNIQLVDSLVEIIEALTPEENALLQEKLQVRTIQVTLDALIADIQEEDAVD